MSKGVFIRNLRARFVEKTSSEVGDGTEFPMEVNLDMVEEILFRVKEANFDGGQIITYWDDSDPGNYPDQAVLLVAPSTTPPSSPYHESENVLFGPEWYYTRGYTTIAPAREYAQAFLGEQYAAWENDLGETYRADILPDERGMWLPEFSDKIADAGVTTDFTTAFSFDSHAHSYPSTDTQLFEIRTGSVESGVVGATSRYGTGFSVVFTGEVAVVKGSPTNDLMSSGNAFYMGLRVRSGRKRNPLSSIYFYYGVSSIPSEEGFLSPYHCGDYEIRLASPPYPTCKLYSDETNVPPADYPSSPGIGTIIHKATKWWPYAKPGGPVFNATTGAKL